MPEIYKVVKLILNFQSFYLLKIFPQLKPKFIFEFFQIKPNFFSKISSAKY